MSAVGKRYRYVSRTGRVSWRGKPPRYGQIVIVLAWRGSRALVRFSDGLIVVCPGRCLRRVQ